MPQAGIRHPGANRFMKRMVLSLLSFAAVAAASPVAVTYVNAGPSNVVDSIGDYVGPYTLNINGTNVAAMCVDDFFYTHGSWSADLTNVTSSNLSETYLGNGLVTIGGEKFSASSIYLAETYLYSQIIRPGADRIDLQDAAWTLMDYATGHNPHSTNQTVNSILSNLPADIASFNASGYEILSEANPGSRPEQEFIYATPEPASVGLMGATLLMLGLIRMKFKRRARTA